MGAVFVLVCASLQLLSKMPSGAKSISEPDGENKDKVVMINDEVLMVKEKIKEALEGLDEIAMQAKAEEYTNHTNADFSYKSQVNYIKIQ